MELYKKRCVPCEGGVRPFTVRKTAEYLKGVKGWKREGKMIAKEFEFKDFAAAMRFVNKVAAIAKHENHHPDIFLHSWNKVRIMTYTHAIGGLSENDFIIAAKIDRT
jgi:4a-hydroxytetrahydrobiopterin dehydratase